MADEIVEMETDYEELPPAPAGVQTARDQEGEEASEEDNNDEEGAAHEEEEEEDGQDSDEEVAGMLTSPAVARKAPASSAQRGRGARARSSPESGEGEERLPPSKQRTPRRSTNSQLDKGKNKKQKRKSTPPPPPAAETFSSPEPEDDPRPQPTFDLSQLRKVARSRSRSRSARRESVSIAGESDEEEEEDPDREDNEERPAIFKHWDSHDKQWRSDRVWLYHVFGSEQERDQLARQIEVRRNWWLGVHSAFVDATLLACCRTMVERWSRSSRTRISPSSLAARPSPSSSRFRRPKAEVRSLPLHLCLACSLTCLSTVHQPSSPSANSGSKNASKAASNTTLSIGAAHPRATKSRSTRLGRAHTFVVEGRGMSLRRGRRRRSRGNSCGCWAES